MGNTLPKLLLADRDWDHPHACGEHTKESLVNYNAVFKVPLFSIGINERDEQLMRSQSVRQRAM